MGDVRRLRITCNGDIDTCRVVDAETGKSVKHVTAVEWKASVEDVPLARVTTLMAEIDVVTGAEVVRVCPECGRTADEVEAARSPTPGTPGRHAFNLNDQIRFKPTEKGLAIWRDHHREMERVLNRPIPLRIDADGFATETFWVAMQVFGPHFGYDTPIETNVELIHRV